MKLECTKEKLRSAVGAAERAAGKNLSLPALAHVLLEATDRGLVIRATNLDLGLTITLPAKVEKKGKVLISGGVMANFLANLAKIEKIQLETTTNTLTVRAGAVNSVFKTYPADDFPTIPSVAGGQTITLSAHQLVDGLRAVVYAASLSDIKPEIASVYLHERDGELLAVATDSFRLAEKKLRPETKLPAGLKLIIPIKNAAETVRILESVAEPVTLSFNQHQLSFSTEQIYLTSRLVEGVFPDYRQIVPTGGSTQAVILKADLLAALRLATIFSDRLNQIGLRAAPAEKLLELSAQNSDIGEATNQLPATLEGEELTISFNARYLLDALGVIGGDSVTLFFNGRGRPMMVRGVGDDSFTYLIMPLNR